MIDKRKSKPEKRTVKIHDPMDVLADCENNKSSFARLVGIHNQNVRLKLAGDHVVVELPVGRMFLDRKDRWC